MRHNCSSTESDYEKYLDIVESMKEMYSILTWNVILYFGKSTFEFYAFMVSGLGFLSLWQNTLTKQSCTIDGTVRISVCQCSHTECFMRNSFSQRLKAEVKILQGLLILRLLSLTDRWPLSCSHDILSLCMRCPTLLFLSGHQSCWTWAHHNDLILT